MATTPEKKKRATYTTPKGESLFAHLVNVDYGTEQYPDEKGSFNVTLALDADAAAKLDSLIAHEVDTARAEAEEKFDGLKPQTKKKFGSVNFNEVGRKNTTARATPRDAACSGSRRARSTRTVRASKSSARSRCSTPCSSPSSCPTNPATAPSSVSPSVARPTSSRGRAWAASRST